MLIANSPSSKPTAITDQNSEADTLPLVSICCNAYNHEPYIRDAIDGFLMQRTTFSVEILIHNDASTDKTAEIIREYENKYPDLFFPVYQQENQHSKGVKISLTYQFPRARGKYIALCEGDDYWTDPLKLQKQVDYLEKNPDCSLVFHAAVILSATDKTPPYEMRNDNKNRTFTMEEIIMGGGGLMATASMVFPAKITEQVNKWAKNPLVGDYPLALTAGAAGKVYYLDEVMSVYRIDVPHSITVQRDLLPFDKSIDRALKLDQILIDFDEYTNHKYRQIIKNKINSHLTEVFQKGSQAPFISQIRAFIKIYKHLYKSAKVKCIKLILNQTPVLSLFYNFLRKTNRLLRKAFLEYPKKILRNYREWRNKKQDLCPPQIILSSNPDHVFFGYYDINPFNSAEDKVLALMVDPELSSPKPGRAAHIGYFDLSDQKPEFIKIDQTETWNWQQGCRLQWYPEGSDTSIFYNRLIDGQYGAVIQEVESLKILHRVNHPVYDLDKTGKWGLSVDFSRLHRLRPGYGYGSIPDKTSHDLCPENDGVWMVDIHKNEKTLLFSLADLAAISPHESMKDAHHYINHLCINPSGKAMLFFHLWVDHHNHRYSRLFAAEKSGENLTLLNNIGHVSHYTWISDDCLLVTTNISKHQIRYVSYHLKNGFDGITGVDKLVTDGHPSFIKRGKFMITDTYPYRNREQKLLLYNPAADSVTVINRYHSPLKFSDEIRCDLHPRPSASGNKICIDAVHNNHRAMLIIDISQIRSLRHY